MPLVSQSLENLLNGVSDQPPISRLDSHAEEEINGMATVEDGLMKRPHSEYVVKLSTTANDHALLHPIVRSVDEKYRVYVADSDIVVEDETTGDLATVLTPDGVGYLDGDNYRAVTVGDTTFIVNRDIEVTKGSTKAAARVPEALIFIRQADYGTTYTVALNNIAVNYKTAIGTGAEERELIATDYIADQIKALIEGEALLDGFTVTRFGSTLYITRTDSKDFTVSAKDGLADGGVVAVKGSIQRFDDLPAFAKDGFIVEITGDPGSDADNYWVVYDDQDSPEEAGVWRETIKPGLITDFDASTMPHQLVYRGSLIGEQESTGAPPEPQITSTGAKVNDGWQTSFGGTNYNDNDLPGLHNEGDIVFGELTAANDLPVTVRVYFDHDGRNTASFVPIRIHMGWTADGSTLHELSYVDTVNQNYTHNDYLQGTDSIPVGASIYLKLTYATGVSPADGHHHDIYAHGKVHPVQPGIQYDPQDAVFVAFEADRKYPGGSMITVTVDGTPCTYTVADGDETGTAIAVALEPTIEAVSGITSDISEAGTIEITKASGLATVTADWDFDPDVSVHVEDADFAALTGYTLMNLTDGSSGTITAGNTTVLTVGSLTGGVSNTFVKGDIIAVYQAGIYFVFQEAEWRGREIGDEDSNPFPSFINRKISDIFFTRGRLGVTSIDNVILSASDDLFNFFRSTATALRDNDPIDIRSSSKSLAEFHAAMAWNEDLYLLTTLGQFRLEGSPILSPTTVALPLVSEYENSSICRPVVLGRSAFLALRKNSRTKVMEYRVSENGLTADAQAVTAFVPQYLTGTPLMMAGHAGLGLLFLLTELDSSTNQLYVMCYADEGGDRAQLGWRKWTFPDEYMPIAIDVVDNTLGISFKHADGQFLETVELDKLKESDGDWAVLLDRRVSALDCTPTFSAVPSDHTTWTVPFSFTDDDQLYMVKKSDRSVVLPADITADSGAKTLTLAGDLVATDYWIGVGYGFEYEFSPFYYRTKEGKTENTGRLDIRRAYLEYSNSLDFTVGVTLPGRTEKLYVFTATDPSDGRFLVPLMGKNDQTVVTITNATPKPCFFRRLDWEGYLNIRHQRV